MTSFVLQITGSQPDVHLLGNVSVCQIAQEFISFFCHCSKVIQEWIHDVVVATQLQDVAPRVLIQEIMRYEMWAISWHVLYVCVSIFTILEVCLVCKYMGIFWIGGAEACVVLILELRLVLFASFWHCWSFQRCVSLDIWHRKWELFVWILVKDGATFLRCHPWNGLAVTTLSSVGLPEGKSSYCRSRWKFLLRACYMLMSYWI